MTDVRITQLDGKLPNLALMRLSAWHKAQGDRVHFYRTPYRQLGEPDYSAVYGSAIFGFSADRVAAFLHEFPGAIVGGTGSGSNRTVEDIVPTQFTALDYAPWDEDLPDLPASSRWGRHKKVRRFKASIGFTQRGCRLSCKFCVVPAKEGKPQSVATVADIWRGDPYPKHLHLLDNDFFGNPEWRDRIAEIREGGFKVCFNQGVNVRAVTDEVAEALASIEYRDDGFAQKRLYTAWDNLKDEAVFFAGVDRLESAGVPPRHLMAYMLIGYAKGETMERIQHRFAAMVARKIYPYPMVYDHTRLDLKRFQRWAITGLHRTMPFEEYSTRGRSPETGPDLFSPRDAA